MRLLVTGSRHWRDRNAIDAELAFLHDEHGLECVIHGDHPGAYLAVDASGVDGVLDEIRLGELGDKFTITVEEWDRADLDALREWDGW